MEDQFLIDFDRDVAADTDLFKAGVIDSFGYIQLMAFIGDEFGFEVAAEDMLMNVLVSLEAIEEFVAGRTAELAAARQGDVTCAE
ncbi:MULTISPECIES: phosphopantetheine-binding protein [unclassified Streptomyces]|uniref:phosphopantetheine-binding protein n=1 Tax=unclassified Streptomyces TaxID=2593676 RepID=UPI002156048F|nr:phosphopantetheine-binding protein [Streptomyces sp. Ru62]